MQVVVISAVHNANGEPDFAYNIVQVTKTGFINGEHFDKVRDILLAAGYEQPFVHFDQEDCQNFPWLLQHVQDYLQILGE